MDNTTNTLAEQSKLRRLVNSYGVPRLIITGFLLLMFILAPVAGVDFATQITNVINRFSRSGSWGPWPATASAGTPLWCWPWSP